MAVEVKRLTSATAVFLGLQSGLARPYWEVNITVSGSAATTSGTLGSSYGFSARQLLSNPGWETGDITGWEDDASMTSEGAGSDVPHTDSYYGDYAGDANDYVYQSVTADTIAGKAYTFSVWLRGSGKVKQALWDNVTGNQLSAEITLTSTWTLYSHTATFDAGSVNRTVTMQITQNATTMDIDTTLLQADNVVLNDLISMGTIDREKPASISGLSRIIAGDVTFTLNNGSGTYSPNATASIFTDAAGTGRDWMHSTINVWAGFENTSGTAYTVQRGSFLLTQLRIDSEKQIAYLKCEDAAKLPLANFLGSPGISGTAGNWTPPSGVNSKAIIIEALSAVGLTGGQYSIASGLNFPGYNVTEEKAGDVIAKVAQAADGYIYTNGAGQVIHELNLPTFGGITADLTAKDSDRISKMRYIVDVKNLVNEVIVKYDTDLNLARGAEDTTVTKGRTQIVSNDVINQASIAISLASRLLGQYSVYRPFIELDNIWLPSLDVGDNIEIHDTNTYQTGVVYEIYRVREDLMNLKTKLYGIYNVDIGKKWGFVSDTSATNLTVAQSGGSEYGVSWHSGFAFAAVSGTAFDNEGNNNDAINTGYFTPGTVGTSGTGVTGIELYFEAY